jgi:hypothetical protein
LNTGTCRHTGPHVTRDRLPVDGQPGGGRWHLYWVDVTPAQLDLLQAQTKHGWYAHFWAGSRLLVIYDDARFELARHDPSTWQPAISHGLGQGLRREWLDFPSDGTIGDLE